MPKAGSLGAETYTGPLTPTQAVEGDYWFNGFALRIFIKGVWVLVAGPSTSPSS